jgi:hypothetical protein
MTLIKKQRATLFLPKDKKRKDGSIPLYVRFKRLGTLEPKYSLNISVQEGEWDDELKRSKNVLNDALIQKEKARIDLCLEQAFITQQELTKDDLDRIIKGDYLQPPRKSSSFYDYWEEYVRTGMDRGSLSNSTRRGYHSTLCALKGFKSEIKIGDISLSLLERFDRYLLSKAKKDGKGDIPGARKNHFKRISSVISYIQALGVDLPNPVKEKTFKLPKEQQNDVYLTEDELIKFLDLCTFGLEYDLAEDGENRFNSLAIFIFSCFTGLRISDATSLRWGNIDISDEQSWILKLRTKKTGKEVIIPLPDRAYLLLKIYSPGREELKEISDEFIFPFRNQNKINKYLQDAAELLEIDKHITFHTARRTLATLLAEKGTSEYFIASILGHSSTTTTGRYQKWTERQAKTHRDKLSII